MKQFTIINGSPEIAKYIREHSFADLSDIQSRVRTCTPHRLCRYPQIANCTMCLQNAPSASTKSYILGGMTQ
jgi:hypothetical protein